MNKFKLSPYSRMWDMAGAGAYAIAAVPVLMARAVEVRLQASSGLNSSMPDSPVQYSRLTSATVLIEGRMTEPNLIAVIEVESTQAIRCQAPGCQHKVYRAIHILDMQGELKLYGSQCCKKLFGWVNGERTPTYSFGGGRLTDEERALLEANTTGLLKMLEAKRRAAQPALHATTQATILQRGARSVGRRAGFRLPIDDDVRQQAKAVIREKHGVDPDLPGWRGLVDIEARKLIARRAELDSGRS